MTLPAEVKILTADKDLRVPRGGQLKVRYRSEENTRKIGLVIELVSFRFAISEAAHGEFPVSCFSTVLGPGQEGTVNIVDKWAGRKTTGEEYSVYTCEDDVFEGRLEFTTGSSLSTWSYPSWNMEHPVDGKMVKTEEERKNMKRTTFAHTSTYNDARMDEDEDEYIIKSTVKSVKMADESASYREVREKVEAAIRFKEKKYAYETHGKEGEKTYHHLPDIVEDPVPKKEEPVKVEPKKRGCCTVC